MHVEPPARNWHRSTRSNSGNCVEVALTSEYAWVRDSKDVRGPVLAFTADEWGPFIAAVRDGHLRREREHSA